MNRLEPRIRFEGFYDEWNKNKIKNISEKIKSYSVSRKYETKESTGLKYVHYGDIHTDVADIVKEDNDLPFIDYKKAKEYLENGDLVIADASEDYDGVANACLIKDIDEKIIAGLHTIALRLSSEISPLYFYYLTKSEKFKKFCKIMATGAKVYGITYNNIANYILDLPEKEEQEKIGTLFERLDLLIEKQEKYLALNKKLKKSLLRKMFPKEGEDYPELRFDKFKDKWMIYNLEDIKNIKIYQPETITSKDMNEDYPYSVFGANGYIGKYFKYNHENEQIAICCRGASCGNINFVKPKTWITGNSFVINLDENLYIDKYFIFCNLSSSNLNRIITGSGQPQITGKNLNKFKIKLPSLKEQEKIGSLFKSLDEKIKNEEERLSSYKDLKKSMLQKMFV